MKTIDLFMVLVIVAVGLYVFGGSFAQGVALGMLFTILVRLIAMVKP